MPHEPRPVTSRLTTGSLVRLTLTVLGGVAGVMLRISGVHLSPLSSLVIFGAAVLAAAFLLAWAAEALQVDISQGLAMAVLAFIAVLPEYAVDLYFAASAARDPAYAQYAAANMTGSNRLLIGVGWPLVALCSVYYMNRRRRATGSPESPAQGVALSPGYGVDLTVLAFATLWSLAMPLSGSIAVWNGVGLLLMFAFYIWRVSGNDDAEPELAGIAQELAELPAIRRRIAVGSLLVLAAGTLLAAAKPFAESLIATGKHYGIDEFLLVQWLAPLASEAPELLVATIFALRGHGSVGMSALLSSKVNQWTLLVGTLPMVYSGARGEIAALPLHARQTEELVLTASQSLLGVAFLLNGRLERWQALTLLALFLVQLPFQGTEVRYGISALYAVLGLVAFCYYRRHVPSQWRETFRRRSGKEGAQP